MKGHNSQLNKHEVFEKELAWIADVTVRDFVSSALDQVPDYFFTMAASTTGKYHPTYALGEGGLVRHTKAAVVMARTMFELEMMTYSSIEQDLITAALILHDGAKCGFNGSTFTVVEHPTAMAEWLVNDMKIYEVLPADQANTILGAIRSHMGAWNKNRSGVEILPKPATKLERFVHLCDYLASRKFLEMEFDKVNYGSSRV